MKKNIFIIIISCFILAGIVCNIEKASGKESESNKITIEKVETLSSSESQNIPPCVDGKGYCFRDKDPYDGLKFKD